MTSRDVDEDKRTTLRRFAALGATLPVAGIGSSSTASADTSSKSDARDAISGYINTTPGAHFSKIRDDLQLGTGETQYHLQELEKSEQISAQKDGDYKRYFIAGEFSDFEKTMLGYLRRETPRHMILTILESPGLTGAALADKIGVSAPTISKYGSELSENNIIARDDGYQAKKPELTITLLLRYANSFDTETVEFAQSADDLLEYRLDTTKR